MTIVAFQFPVFQPALRIISNITTSNPAQVTTTFDHQYVSGTIVRLDIPPQFGMQQANKQFGSIVVTSPTTFDIALDSTLFDEFSTPSQYPFSAQYAQCNAFAEDNGILTAAVQNVLPYKVS